MYILIEGAVTPILRKYNEHYLPLDILILHKKPYTRIKTNDENWCRSFGSNVQSHGLNVSIWVDDKWERLNDDVNKLYYGLFRGELRKTIVVKFANHLTMNKCITSVSRHPAHDSQFSQIKTLTCEFSSSNQHWLSLVVPLAKRYGDHVVIHNGLKETIVKKSRTRVID